MRGFGKAVILTWDGFRCPSRTKMSHCAEKLMRIFHTVATWTVVPVKKIAIINLNDKKYE